MKSLSLSKAKKMLLGTKVNPKVAPFFTHTPPMS
uniref:Uncharacterized protein n=1 Tax=Arundo donax TaxID=35708 RepID=A0A0A9DXT9_ARUDO